jgi:hypothetical protein
MLHLVVVRKAILFLVFLTLLVQLVLFYWHLSIPTIAAPSDLELVETGHWNPTLRKTNEKLGTTPKPSTKLETYYNNDLQIKNNPPSMHGNSRRVVSQNVTNLGYNSNLEKKWHTMIDDVTVKVKKAPSMIHEKEDSTRPLFVLHVGPPKTASTTLQHFLDLYQPLLSQDNYTFFGPARSPIRTGLSRQCGRNVRKARNHDKPIEQVPCWKDMLDALRELRLQGNHVIVSEENMAAKEIKLPLVQDILKDWNVRIVVSYRRYQEWIVSAKNQEERPSSRHFLRSRWPHTSGLPTLPHFPYISEVINGSRPMPLWYTDKVQARYQEAGFASVVLWNLHASNNLVASFTCDVLKTNSACQESLSIGSIPRVNPSVPLEYDMLATAAAQRGWVNLALERVAVANRTRVHHEQVLGKGTGDFANICPTQIELNGLLEASKSYEHMLLTEFYASSQGRRQLEADFETAVQNKKYCSIDTDTVLKDPAWQQFFQSL